MKNKITAENFISWKSDDGLLEIIGIVGKDKTQRNTLFKVICHKCKEDKELFPDGYFISSKTNLNGGKKPCGCSKAPKWSKEQYLILAKRAGEGRFIVHGLAESYKGIYTKLNLECLVDGHKWESTIHSIINKKTGCHRCVNVYRPTNEEALEKCKAICEIEGYDPVGFVDEYIGAHKTRFEYMCPIHGIQNVSYDCFINSGTRCGDCARDNNGFNGYFSKRKGEQDFLYILNFDNKFIKVGRSFVIDKRIIALQSASSINNIVKLRIFTATHQEVYDTEQAILEELRERGFQYNLSWTKECFENGCLYSLNKLLDLCDLEELPIE